MTIEQNKVLADSLHCPDQYTAVMRGSSPPRDCFLGKYLSESVFVRLHAVRCFMVMAGYQIISRVRNWLEQKVEGFYEEWPSYKYL